MFWVQITPSFNISLYTIAVYYENFNLTLLLHTFFLVYIYIFNLEIPLLIFDYLVSSRDLGAHIDGFIAVVAHTLVVGASKVTFNFFCSAVL